MKTKIQDKKIENIEKQVVKHLLLCIEKQILAHIDYRNKNVIYKNENSGKSITTMIERDLKNRCNNILKIVRGK